MEDQLYQLDIIDGDVAEAMGDAVKHVIESLEEGHTFSAGEEVASLKSNSYKIVIFIKEDELNLQ